MRGTVLSDAYNQQTQITVACKVSQITAETRIVRRWECLPRVRGDILYLGLITDNVKDLFADNQASWPFSHLQRGQVSHTRESGGIIQALERRTGYAVSSDKKLIQGIESIYKRNGTVNVFAALSVASGNIHGKVTHPGEKTKKGFLAFMDDLLEHFNFEML